MPPENPFALRALDVALGVGATVTPPLWRAAKLALLPAQMTWEFVTEPPLLAPEHAPRRWVEAAERRGQQLRSDSVITTADRLAKIADVFVPVLLFEALKRLDLVEIARTALPAEQLNRELDILVPFATEAILSRLEPVTLIESNLGPEQVEKLLDVYLSEVADLVLKRLDLTAIVKENVDLTDLTRGVLGEIDIVDLTAMVIAELDLAGIANEVIDEIDLPDIIRESSTGVASEALGGARDSAADADDLISNFFGRKRKEPTT